MSVNSKTYLEVAEYDEFPPTYRLHGLGWSDSQDALAMRLNFFPELHAGALEKILEYMRKHNIPVLQPESFKLELVLTRAGVKIANPWEVAP